MQRTELRNYVDMYLAVQDIRVAVSNRINPNNSRNKGANLNSGDREQYVSFCKGVLNQIDAIEVEMLENPYVLSLVNRPENYRIYKWLTANKGIKHVRACGIIALIGNIKQFDSASSLWSYSGYGVVTMCKSCDKRIIRPEKLRDWIEHTADKLDLQNQKRIHTKKADRAELIEKAKGYLCSCDHPEPIQVGQKRIPGQLPDYNSELKKQVYLCVSQFIRLKNPNLYSRYYRSCKAAYMERPDLKAEMDKRKGGLSKGTARIENMARRKVAKLFLSHIYQIWQEIEGNPNATDAYVFDILGHKDHIAPEIKLTDVDFTKPIRLKFAEQIFAEMEADDNDDSVFDEFEEL